MPKIKSLEEYMKEVNQYGSISSPRYKFVKLKGRSKYGNNLIEIKCLEGYKKDQTSLVLLSNLKKKKNPFFEGGKKGYSEGYTKELFFKYTKNFYPKIKFVELGKRDSSGKQLIKVECLDGSRKGQKAICSLGNLKKKKNPFFEGGKKGYSEGYTKELFFKYTKNFYPKIKFIELKRNSAGRQIIKVECLDGYKKGCFSNIRLYSLKRGRNPFVEGGSKGYSEGYTKKLFLKYTKNFYPKIKFVELGKRDSSGKQLIKVECLDGIRKGSFANVRLGSLKIGQNPFNEDQKRIELIEVQPQYEKLFKKLNIKYKKEFMLGKKRIDFCLELQNKRYGLEVKQSNKTHAYTKKQLNTYRRLSKLKQYNLESILLSDPLGKQPGSISISKLENLIKSIKNNRLNQKSIYLKENNFLFNSKQLEETL